MQRALRALASGGRYSLLSDGALLPAFGVLGGRSGVPVGAWINRDGTIEQFDTPGKVAGHPVQEGSQVVIRSAGGGGYGDPLNRDPQRVALDVQEGYVSLQSAADIYGVVLQASGEVDLGGTAARRKNLRASRRTLRAVLDDSVFEAGAVSRRRICWVNPADAEAFGVAEDEIVELDAGRAAPLRAWIRRDGSVTAGTLPMDARGLKILMSAAGDPIHIRRLSAATSAC